jgi:hypothetical protein
MATTTGSSGGAGDGDDGDGDGQDNEEDFEPEDIDWSLVDPNIRLHGGVQFDDNAARDRGIAYGAFNRGGTYGAFPAFP